MTNAETLELMNKLVPHDSEGKVIPSDEAVLKVATEYPNESAAKGHRLAQAETMIQAAIRGGISEEFARLALPKPDK